MKNSLLFSLSLLLGSTVLFASGLPKQSVQALIKGLQDSSVEVRVGSAEALSEVKDAADQAVKPLENALMASSDAAEQDAIIKALILADDSETVKRLEAALANPQFTWGNGAKPKAVDVIAKIGQKKAIKWLTDMVAGEQEPAVRAAAAKALGKIGGVSPYEAKNKNIQEVYVINPK